MFYALLNRHREAQLENYTPDLEYSNSDYHHVRPSNLRKTYSTRHFSQNQTNGHKRTGSKFTVISNSAETEMSYDPFKASRPQRLSSLGVPGARITIHHGDGDGQTGQGDFAHRHLSARSAKHLAPPKFGHTRSSLASSVKSNTSGSYVRAARRYKRGVSFDHLRSTTSLGSPASSKAQRQRRHSNHTEVTDDGGDTLRPVNRGSPSARYIRSKKTKAGSSRSGSPAKKAARNSLLWGEDVRQLSNSLAKDCDDAFNRGSVMKNEETIIDIAVYNPEKSSARSSVAASQVPKSRLDELIARPLPAPPARTESVKIELEQQKLQFELRKELEGASAHCHLDRMVTHLDELMRSPSSVTGERRASSAPLETRQKGRQLPSIHESGAEEPSSPRRRHPSRYHRTETKNSRIASAPEPRDMSRVYPSDRSTKPNSYGRDTIRVVQSSLSQSPVKMPAPLTIRKKSSQAAPPPSVTNDSSSDWESVYSYQPPTSLRQQYSMGNRGPAPGLTPITERHYDEEMDTENASAPSNAGTVVRKRSGWFRRNSRASDDSRLSAGGSETQSHQRSNSGGFGGIIKKALSERSDNPVDKPQPPLPSPKKKKVGILGKLFKKRSMAEMEVAGKWEISLIFQVADLYL